MNRVLACHERKISINDFIFIILLSNRLTMKKTLFSTIAIMSLLGALACQATDKPKSYSGIYPHLAFYNDEGECGTGAVVPWAGYLWAMTYGPHLPNGSSDKLYQIDSDLNMTVRPESIGGTPANRMIHKESGQLFMGPYVIDQTGKVRVIPYAIMPGRLTGAARHLKQPESRLYIGTMEEGFYDIDVKTLDVKTLYADDNKKLTEEQKKEGISKAKLPGWHGKGMYSGQGVLIFANNGETGAKALKQYDLESGVLAEWNGRKWKVVRRNQFTEITGPGGISGNSHPETDPIWSIGWDHRSILLALRDKGKWQFFRLPKASNTYDGAHGWNTEWPRIRDVGTKDKPFYLMTMHGMFWQFPPTFSVGNTADIRPLSSYLKVIGDFARWNNQLVFGCDDSAQKEFLNKRSLKGNIKGPGQSNSNLWFVKPDMVAQLGPNTAAGSVWMEDDVKANEPSDPFLFAGWPCKSAWLRNDSTQSVSISFQADPEGKGQWKTIARLSLPAQSSQFVPMGKAQPAEWIRLVADRNAKLSAEFTYRAQDSRSTDSDPIFKGLSPVTNDTSTGAIIYARGANTRTMGVLAGQFKGTEFKVDGFYELDGKMNLTRKEGPTGAAAKYAQANYGIKAGKLMVDDASIVIIDDAKPSRRWRLPKGNGAFLSLEQAGAMRVCREVATERDLLHAMGTFFELPAENADGFAKIRPIATHSFRIHDYASFRGLLVLSGIDPQAAQGNSHVVVSGDGKAAVWAGAIDDLWKLGKPVGVGGPWKDSAVVAGTPSDPYLIAFYDNRSMELSHKSTPPVTFTIEANPIGHGPWMVYKKVTVKPGETWKHVFPDDFEARWIRLTADQNTTATAWLKYE